MKVGFIGLGRMGQAMARRVLDAGHDIALYNRTPDKIADLVAAGATAAGSVADAARHGGVVITMLVEIAMISPPDGTVLYVLQGMRRQPGPITDVFAGVMPFMFVYMLAIGILMLFPSIALWLPSVLS